MLIHTFREKEIEDTQDRKVMTYDGIKKNEINNRV